MGLISRVSSRTYRYVSALQFSELTGGGATDDLYMRISAIGHPKFDRQEQDGRTRHFSEVCTYWRKIISLGWFCLPMYGREDTVFLIEPFIQVLQRMCIL